MASARNQRSRRGRRDKDREDPLVVSQPEPRPAPPWMVPALAGGLVALSFTPRVAETQILQWSFWAAAAFLVLWHVALVVRSRGGEPLTFTSKLRPQHYLQAVVQLAVFAYWGYFWRPVYDFGLLLLAQILFAYGFDMLLHLWRRGSYVLGFGPFPIVFSTNLFLWFRDDWFYLQFLMLGVGFLGKEFVRWSREGRSRHIFNPSAFSLGLFSVILIVTGASDLTWGQEIASTLTLAPRIYLFLFLLGLVVMYFFNITLVAGMAAATLFGMSALYSVWAGVPYFVDSDIPAAVFLGLHLLVTDPSTSPRTPLGKAIFGGLYGVGVFVLYAGLGAMGAPTFYDKLLCVPLLNLSVQWIDRVARAVRSWKPLEGLQITWSPRAQNYAHMAVWSALFLVMTALGRTDGRHPGDSLPFWQQACEDGRRNACGRLIQLEETYCGDNSAWACNELGTQYVEGRIVNPDPELAMTYFAKACELRYRPGCFNLLEPGSVANANPRLLDLRLLLREGGRNLMEVPERELYGRACEHDWTFACRRLAGSL